MVVSFKALAKDTIGAVCLILTASWCWERGETMALVVCFFKDIKDCVLGIAKCWTPAEEIQSGKSILKIAVFKSWQKL